MNRSDSFFCIVVVCCSLLGGFREFRGIYNYIFVFKVDGRAKRWCIYSEGEYRGFRELGFIWVVYDVDS